MNLANLINSEEVEEVHLEPNRFWYVTHQENHAIGDVWCFWRNKMFIGFNSDPEYEVIDKYNLTYVGCGLMESIKKEREE